MRHYQLLQQLYVVSYEYLQGYFDMGFDILFQFRSNSKCSVKRIILTTTYLGLKKTAAVKLMQVS